MNNSQIVATIQLLSIKERKRFKEFVNSPYFNKHKKTILLLDYILSSTSNNSKKSLDKNYLLKVIFPNEKSSFQKLKDLSSNLMKLLELFMATQEFGNKPLTQNIYTCNYAYKTKLNSFLLKQINKIRKKLESYQYRDTYYYETLKDFLTLEYLYYTGNREHKKGYDIKEEILQNNKTTYYLQTLKIFCSFKIFKLYYNFSFDSAYIEPIITDIKKNISIYKDEPTLILYYIIYNLLFDKEDSDKNIKKIADEIDQYFNLIPYEEANNLYSIILNYYGFKVNRGENEYARDMFNIYKKMDKNNCILQSNIISSSRYSNTIEAACEVKDFEWAEYFVNKYNPHLIQLNKEQLKFSLGYIYYKKGELNKVINIYQDLNFNKINSTYAPRITLSKTYMELEEWNLLENHLESFRIYCLRKKDLSKALKKGHINFITFTQKLVFIIQTSKSETKKRLAKKLRKALDENTNVISKNWLISQYEKYLGEEDN